MSNKPTIQSSWLAFLRAASGALWLNEVFYGADWKIGHAGWVGANAGAEILRHAQVALNAGVWSWYGWFLETLVIPYAATWSYIILTTQVAAGLALMFGLLTRYAAIGTIIMTTAIVLIGSTPNATILLMLAIVVLATDASRTQSLDARLRKWNFSEKYKRWLGLLPLSEKIFLPLAVGAGTFSLVAFLQIPNRLSTVASLIAFDLCVILGISAITLLRVHRGAQAEQSWVEGLRIFIGLIFLSEIFTRTVPGLIRLPAFGTTYGYAELFHELQQFGHWPVMNWLLENVFAAAPLLWVWIFGLVQFGVGCCLVWGLWSRPAAKIGLIYLTVICLAGFVRINQFLLLPMITLLAAGAGASFSLDGMLGRTDKIKGWMLKRERTAILLSLGAVLAGGLSLVTYGFIPAGYQTNLAGLIGSLLILYGLMLAVAFQWQRKSR